MVVVARRTGPVCLSVLLPTTGRGPSWAFGYSFAESLREELRGSGVTVTALLPGATDSDFHQRAGMRRTAVGKGVKNDRRLVAEQGVGALLAGKDTQAAATGPPSARPCPTGSCPSPSEPAVREPTPSRNPHRLSGPAVSRDTDGRCPGSRIPPCARVEDGARVPTCGPPPAGNRCWDRRSRAAAARRPPASMAAPRH